MARSREQNPPEAEATHNDVERGSSEVESRVAPAPNSADETTADDPVTASGVATEERTPTAASGLPADDPDAGEERKKLYERGATLVSRID